MRRIALLIVTFLVICLAPSVALADDITEYEREELARMLYRNNGVKPLALAMGSCQFGSTGSSVNRFRDQYDCRVATYWDFEDVPEDVWWIWNEYLNGREVVD